MTSESPEDTFDICEQRQAILEASGHTLVVGGPGSGKTTIALLKARRFAADGMRANQKVLFLSFSNAAIRRLAESAGRILSGDEVRDRVVIKTYHSFAWEVLRAHGYLLSSRRQLKIVSAQDADVRRAGLSREDWNIEQDRLFNEEGLLTYDRFAPKVAELFERCSRLRRLYSDAHPLIVVDEFQDTDTAQWRLVSLLAEASCIVAMGDAGQRIYSWRPGVEEGRLEQFKKEMGATAFDFGNENNRSPGTGIMAYGQALLRPGTKLPDCDELETLAVANHQFSLAVKLATKHALGHAQKRAASKELSIAVAGRSKAVVRLVSDALSKSQTAKGRVHKPVQHDVLIDQSQVLLSARVTSYLLEAGLDGEQVSLAKTIELIADMFRAGGKKTHIATADRLVKWAVAIRAGKVPGTKLVKGVAELLAELKDAGWSGSPMADWIAIRDRLAAQGADELLKVSEHVRFLRLLRRGSVIEEQLAGLWRTSGNYHGAMAAVESALTREQVLDTVRPPARCTVMTMHQLKGREYDAVVLIEDQYRRFLAGDEAPPYMDTRRLLQVCVTRARHYVVIVTSRKDSTLRLLDG